MDQKLIRNFAIIAHVDHGKSTLADRFLELTRTVPKEKMAEQFLDQNPISRERGITIKLAPVRMNYALGDTTYTLNLIDTPGHVDFSYEVSRTLAACDGVILLVDATQNIQAQTVAHYNSAKKEGLTIIPVINKIDLPNAETEKVAKTLSDFFGFDKEEILFVSAKTGENVRALLETVIQRIPSPTGRPDSPLRALVFDAVFDEHKGVVAFVRIFDGVLSKGEDIMFFSNNERTKAVDVGYFSPYLVSQATVGAGEIGYIITGIKDIRLSNVGDTITSSEFRVQNLEFKPLPGYKKPKPMVFFGMYPKTTNNLVKLKGALSKLSLTDSSITYTEEYSQFLGSGFRVGFLGLLHAEIVKERLQKEDGVELLLTKPQVLYEKRGEQFLEPYMKLSVYTPSSYVGAVMTLCQKRKGTLMNLSYHDEYAVLWYEMPFSMITGGLSSEIKSISSGFASLDYELIGFKEADLVRLDVLVNGVSIDVLSEYVYREDAIHKAFEKTKKLKETMTRQQFRQIIQAVMEGRIVAREEIPPYRKDVLAKMSGGDRTRKDKLLKKQKKGKSRILEHARVELPQEALFSIVEYS